MFSTRAQWSAALNRLTVERRKRSNLLDLTETNPTRAGIDYPHDELAEIFARAARASYDPDPRGLRSAREALGDPDDLILTASTSEAYSFLFKLLTDPGGEVLMPVPSYPLLEHLAQLEQVQLRTFALEFHGRWEIPDFSCHSEPRRRRGIPGQRSAHRLSAGDSSTVLRRSAAAAARNDTVRAIVVVNPNNPTGSFVTPREQDAIAAHGVPVISDEVFLDYPLDAQGTSFVRDDVLTFTLGGLSKSAGMPHYKLAWIRVSGPGKREALEALELIADNFLSVATPVQVALPELLRIAPCIRDAIRARTRRNLDVLRGAVPPHVQVLPVEGGWSVVLRVPRTMTDEELALELLDRSVIVQPGYFFDFEYDGFIVLSLLTPEDVFAEGVRRVLESL